MGSLFWDVIPNATIILPEDEHHRYVDMRPDLTWENAYAVRQHLKGLEVKTFSSWIALLWFEHQTTAGVVNE